MIYEREQHDIWMEHSFTVNEDFDPTRDARAEIDEFGHVYGLGDDYYDPF